MASRREAVPEHAPENVMRDTGEIVLFHDRCSVLMRSLLEALARAPDEPVPFSVVEDGLRWPRRRIASILGGVAHMRRWEFHGRRPYHLLDASHSGSGRWEIWVDRAQAKAIHSASA